MGTPISIQQSNCVRTLTQDKQIPCKKRGPDIRAHGAALGPPREQRPGCDGGLGNGRE